VIVAEDVPGVPVATLKILGAVTIWTLVVAVTEPFAFVAVRVKTVEVARAGVVVLVPVTVPITGLIESAVAPVSVQLKVVVPFGTMGFGDALNPVIEGRMPESVVPEALVEEAETLPTLSWAVTSYQ
jgi:hypothetical protein